MLLSLVRGVLDLAEDVAVTAVSEGLNLALDLACPDLRMTKIACPKKLRSDDPEYVRYAGLFKKGWLHPNKSANVIGVYLAKNCDLKNSEKGASFGSIRASFGQHSDRFHGTQIACCLTTDANGYFVPCRNSDCNFCRIFRESFRIDKASAGGMFGAGIYSSSCSSKADNYSRNHHIRTTIHAVIICRVVLGRKQLLKTEDRNRKAPDNGFLSVEAVTKKNGGSVEYPESITYWEDCVIPVGFILYERSGWDGGR